MSQDASAAACCIQPDHFYPNGYTMGKRHEPGALLDPSQDPFATRGIPVFRPSMEEFQDFEAYMEMVQVWGARSGIVKIIPPREWAQSLPSTVPLLPSIKVKNPIEQRMEGGGGLFRQCNVEKRKTFTIMEFAQMCWREDLRSPSPSQTARSARSSYRCNGTSGESDSEHNASSVIPFDWATVANSHNLSSEELNFYSTFDPHSAWLPPDTQTSDYTPEACRNLERIYWRTCGISAPAWYGADMQGSLFTDATTTFNVARLPSLLSRLSMRRALPGVNTPYLYFGMWRATFAWHVEDMDLYSINYIHWGAPKQWYAVPNERSKMFEAIMRGYFPSDTSACPEFLRHKSYLASPTLLAQASCRPNPLVQHQGEFVITFPRGYHAGYNMGFNCAESVNFALKNWVDIGRKAKFCTCVPDSVRIDVDALLAESRESQEQEERKRRHLKRKIPPDEVLVPSHLAKHSARHDSSPATLPAHSTDKLLVCLPKRISHQPQSSGYFCCLCPSSTTHSSGPLLRCASAPPTHLRGQASTATKSQSQPLPQGLLPVVGLRAHETCALVLPETWIDVVDGENVVCGLDCIGKDRWSLKCSVCISPAQKQHGAKIQCTRGKCIKAFHVTCALQKSDIAFNTELTRSDVVLVDPASTHSDQDLSSTSPIRSVKKLSYELLCSQHNPIVQQRRRTQRLDRMQADLLALPPDSRIRVRVSSGVFEVTLVQVNVPEHSILVQWGDGKLRDLKWGCIVKASPKNVLGTCLPSSGVTGPDDLELKSVGQNLSFTPGQSTTTTLPPSLSDPDHIGGLLGTVQSATSPQLLNIAPNESSTIERQLKCICMTPPLSSDNAYATQGPLPYSTLSTTFDPV
ncbi:JmjC domain, hydroxylase-domain-containing protein [Cantharellus anzutake]|uniref:JmjC domain, hydroxylase-domain-containing protein n=1 Tax=Cantharellus anzutake TaxID=1750568 RepID=UPI0019061463|nr:JmjC domain, hydroxylase-domain-containing protein [Cantharellus anzutake]XP_038920115.1 JmjC domain, hydroxylase-domain-containing protein [Cantharellus anzutake]KAF8313558.1 JmjC domain, hydroxylase-domain-containing protein [Cantharellus anzutake]KAF8337643.1 JmjC domain, hydroxylase-domain-containing protein [Cantharellus anzutake]